MTTRTPVAGMSSSETNWITVSSGRINDSSDSEEKNAESMTPSLYPAVILQTYNSVLVSHRGGGVASVPVSLSKGGM